MRIEVFGNGWEMLSHLGQPLAKGATRAIAVGLYKIGEPLSSWDSAKWKSRLRQEAIDCIVEVTPEALVLVFDVSHIARVERVEKIARRVISDLERLSPLITGYDLSPIAVLANGETELEILGRAIERGDFSFSPAAGGDVLRASELKSKSPRWIIGLRDI